MNGSKAHTVQAQETKKKPKKFIILQSQSKGKYEIATGVLKSPDELVDLYQTLFSKYPAVVALIDPLRREVSLKHNIFQP